MVSGTQMPVSYFPKKGLLTLAVTKDSVTTSVTLQERTEGQDDANNFLPVRRPIFAATAFSQAFQYSIVHGPCSYKMLQL